MSRMHYKALITVPVVFEVEVMQENLYLDQAERVLLEKATDLFNRAFGDVLAVDFKEMAVLPNTLVGTFVDHSSPETIAHFDKRELNGDFATPVFTIEVKSEKI